ncbi:TRAFAC clade GTPase domain-containing protein [Brevundimonas pondensis]|uniref:Double-GTPase 2 domain-containing protein n=1 Tax=Brevundimonas pondensis TaxID=2774189 RepID=A0ABX7SNC2_9CAUL|nr:hypothetical protein [Brevundimonas pondensis]QTC89194.1 hypothetical protein IFE19_07670 [Brevundimonas pondensis]
MTSDTPTCSNHDCRVAEDGKCVEGYELPECPHYGKLSVDAIPEPQHVEVAPPVPETVLIALDAGTPLDRTQAARLQQRFLSLSVGVVGPHDSGKTSLIAGLYDQLQEGPVGAYAFAGSSTLVGFEMVCHHARSESQREEPFTDRTIRGAAASFFHLDFSGSSSAEILSLFIGDRSGEDYLTVTDDLANADGLFELRRANVVTVLVDGAHLIDSEQRHEVKAITPQIVDALIEAAVLGSRQRLVLVLTKKDMVLASANAERAMSEFEGIVTSIRNRHDAKLEAVESFVIAASPKALKDVQRGEGLSELLASWLRVSAAPASLPSPSLHLKRQIDQFTASEDTQS